jgi:hypothetical protein
VGGGVGEGALVNRDRVASAGIARVAQGRWRRRRRGEEAVVLRMQVDAGVRRPASSAPR